MATEVLTISAGGEQLRGWLTEPESPGPHPVVIISHGYSVTHAIFYWRAAAFAEAGIAVLDFDQRRLGASSGSPRQKVDVKDQIDDLRTVVDFARSLPRIDPDRVAILGSSLGAGIAIEVAAADPRLAALALIVPHVDGLTNVPRASVRQRLWLLGQVLLDRLGRVVGRPPRTVQVFGPPRSRALITFDDGFGWIQEEAEPGGSWDGRPGGHYVSGDTHYINEVTAYEVLQTLRFRPGKRLKHLSVPTLMMIGTRDTVSPPGPQRRLAADAACVRLLERDWNHFSAFRASESFAEATSDQLAFLRDVLAVPAS